MDTHTSLIVQIIGGILGVCLTVMFPFVIGWKNRTDKRLDKIENNYVKEFQSVREAISNATISQLQAISSLEQRLSAGFIRADLCEAKMEAADKV